MSSYGSLDRKDKVLGNEDGGIEDGRAPAQSPDKVPLIWTSDRDDTHQRIKKSSGGSKGETQYNMFHYLVYAIINVIIAVPGLYGYASVIFNHPAFQPHLASLSKVVVFSSLVHQLGFTLFSSLDFSIGTVQDAGLIFLSSMANSIAESILNEGGTIEEVISTTLVILPLGTATLGIVLIFLGKFRLLDIVAFIPMPVIGGYLAFIGYFCLEAGVALCIGKSMTELSDWRYLLEPHNLLLATPGLLSAAVLTIISRKAKNDAVLPIAMVIIPATFYAVLFFSGTSLEEARDEGWVGEEVPPVPVQDLLHLVDFNLVHWRLISKCIGTWVGMVFVVSFASCLDIAAISMDMGEALDTNKEMVTVGTANLMSGLTFGFTGSYIFSQTIFTYRTGCHSRYIGVLIMAAYLAVCVSSINILQIAPLFFLGATLIFIGYDLLWEWLIDIRAKIFFREYMVLLVTFVAIQMIGMDFGILFGVVVALVEHVASTTRVSSMGRILKRSRAVWSKEAQNILQNGYNADDPKIVTLEIKGPVFFGSSQKLMSDITDEIGLSMSEEEMKRIAFASPHTSTPHSSLRAQRVKSPRSRKKEQYAKRRSHPQFVVLDFTLMHNLDASAATSCFLQLAKLCEKRGILLCASGAIPRVEWMLRSHNVAYELDEEIDVKNDMLSNPDSKRTHGKLILFLTIFEALEFSERLLIRRVLPKVPYEQHLQSRLSTVSTSSPHHQVAFIFLNVLRGELSTEEKEVVDSIEQYYEKAKYRPGEPIFQKNTHPDAFFIVLQGSVAVPADRKGSLPLMIRSGTGTVQSPQSLSSSNLFGIVGDDGEHKCVESFHKVGGIVGYCDFMLERYRTFDAVAASNDGATVAVFSRTNIDRMKNENHPLYVIVQKLLLRASLMDLANCTCHN
eukprot:CAMPEP_0172316884 /NCGR_PEP_ID=MMETSP1058-20130122/29856_1 /TAXON_ID=83371 /ORGANISM="Detonula confervacea, Strain CCMP 353" /LENGTH=901 /DNA_ID=CAMNT_0013031315 /DNA_START=50 /DNA_END=2755 /DNA_ORIENTATION=+